jgi:hypothetical protein
MNLQLVHHLARASDYKMNHRLCDRLLEKPGPYQDEMMQDVDEVHAFKCCQR